MNHVVIEETGFDLVMKAKSRWNRFFFGVPRVPQSWTEKGRLVFKDAEQQDREQELIFNRWASQLNESLVLCIFKDGHPKAGQKIKPNDIVGEFDTIDEEHSVYEWAKELASLEMTAMNGWDKGVMRMHMIAEMFLECRLIWTGGPAWWRQL